MELIKNLDTKINKLGRVESWAVFWCAFCSQEVEKELSSGKKAKSCGCVQYILSAETNKGFKHTEETRSYLSLTKIGKNNPNYGKFGKNNPRYGIKQSENTKEKIRQKHLGMKQSEETKYKIRESLLGENNPNYGKFGELSSNWSGGISFEPYAPEFNKGLKQFILERDNYTCKNPSCKHISNKLHIHHIDYDKKNSNPENLITLCDSCHTKTNGKNNRKYFIEFYQNILANNILECFL